MKQAIVMAMIVLAMGCKTTHKDGDRFPAVIRDICEQAEAEARAKVISMGATPANVKARVYLVAGTVNLNGWWGVKSDRVVGGISGGWAIPGKIHIVHPPNNPRGLYQPALVHEFGHQFVPGDGHPARFKGVFVNWADNSAW